MSYLVINNNSNNRLYSLNTTTTKEPYLNVSSNGYLDLVTVPMTSGLRATFYAGTNHYRPVQTRTSFSSSSSSIKSTTGYSGVSTYIVTTGYSGKYTYNNTTSTTVTTGYSGKTSVKSTTASGYRSTLLGYSGKRSSQYTKTTLWSGGFTGTKGIVSQTYYFNNTTYMGYLSKSWTAESGTIGIEHNTNPNFGHKVTATKTISSVNGTTLHTASWYPMGTGHEAGWRVSYSFRLTGKIVITATYKSTTATRTSQVTSSVVGALSSTTKITGSYVTSLYSPYPTDFTSTVSGTKGFTGTKTSNTTNASLLSTTALTSRQTGIKTSSNLRTSVNTNDFTSITTINGVSSRSTSTTGYSGKLRQTTTTGSGFKSKIQTLTTAYYGSVVIDITGAYTSFTASTFRYSEEIVDSWISKYTSALAASGTRANSTATKVIATSTKSIKSSSSGSLKNSNSYDHVYDSSYSWTSTRTTKSLKSIETNYSVKSSFSFDKSHNSTLTGLYVLMTRVMDSTYTFSSSTMSKFLEAGSMSTTISQLKILNYYMKERSYQYLSPYSKTYKTTTDYSTVYSSSTNSNRMTVLDSYTKTITTKYATTNKSDWDWNFTSTISGTTTTSNLISSTATNSNLLSTTALTKTYEAYGSAGSTHTTTTKFQFLSTTALTRTSSSNRTSEATKSLLSTTALTTSKSTSSSSSILINE